MNMRQRKRWFHHRRFFIYLAWGNRPIVVNRQYDRQWHP